MLQRRQSAPAASARHIPEHGTPQSHLPAGAHSLGTRAAVCVCVCVCARGHCSWSQGHSPAVAAEEPPAK